MSVARPKGRRLRNTEAEGLPSAQPGFYWKKAGVRQWVERPIKRSARKG